MKKSYLLTLTVLVLLLTPQLLFAASKHLVLLSPDGKVKTEITLADNIQYSVSINGGMVLKDCELGMSLKETTLGSNPKLLSKKASSINESIKPLVPLKFSTVENHCNVLTMHFKGDYAVEFRAYNEGVAYRFVLNKSLDSLLVVNEKFVIHFPSPYLLHLQQVGGFMTSYETAYSRMESKDWKVLDKMATLPVLMDSKQGIKVLFSEANVFDYPGMFVKSNGDGGIQGTFPKVPLVYGENGDRNLKIEKEADYIAKTSGKRSFPWRYFLISTQDGQIAENTMNVRLSEASEIKDPSWIKSGQVTWEWWNDACPYGPDVNFKSGYNLETYKYYIDFAAKYHIPYLLMDEGWAKSTLDPYTPNPTVDVHQLIAYGKQRNVRIFLWLTWLTVDRNMELFKTFHDWGIAGVKIDFMDRSDQWMVNYYERVAKAAAQNHLMVDFHGAYKPSGLEFRYPNVLAYEGVRGMEQMGGATPDNSVFFPFMRNSVGAMDYTPGAMLSMQPEVYCSRRPNAASIGTRAYQMALYVVFESGLQMLADNPTLYYRNAACTEFITQVPTTWDETKVLKAEAGAYIIVAKRKGSEWFVGAICNNAEKERDFEINLDFLSKDQSHSMTSFRDGINADRQAMDYRQETQTVSAGQSIKIHMVRNGGWAAVIK